MKHVVMCIAAPVIIAFTLTACTSPPKVAPPPVSPRSIAPDSTAPRCAASALALRYGPRLSPMTGEHGAYYALVNRGAAVCTLTGYPIVVLADARGVRLPFRYTHRHSPYVTSAPPPQVFLRPGTSAYVLVAKYRCDLGVARDVATIRLTLPGPHGGTMSMPVAASPSGGPALSYCSGGPDDPGQLVGVSPIEPTVAAAGAVANRNAG